MKHRPVLYVENDRADLHADLVRTIDSLSYNQFWHIVRLYNPDNFYGNQENVFNNIASFDMLCVPRERPDIVLGGEKIEPPEVGSDESKSWEESAKPNFPNT
jgi:hypothetical protein